MRDLKIGGHIRRSDAYKRLNEARFEYRSGDWTANEGRDG